MPEETVAVCPEKGWDFWSEALDASLHRIARDAVRRRPRMRLSVEDVVSACYLELCERIDRSDLAWSPAFDSDDPVRLLVRAVVEDLARPLDAERRALRRRGKERLRGEGTEIADWRASQPSHDGVPRADTESDEPHDGVSAADRLSGRVRSLCPPLTPGQLEVLSLRADGLSYREIGKSLGRDASSIRERMHRVARRLRGHAGRRSDRLTLPIAPEDFFIFRPPQWRRIYRAWRHGDSRAAISRREGLSKGALAALVRRLRRALQRAQV